MDKEIDLEEEYQFSHGKKEQTAKRARAQRPVRRETKEVPAELVEKLKGKLELKATTSASPAEAVREAS